MVFAFIFRPEVNTEDFSGVRKKNFPAGRSSSELSAHQMAPSGVIAHCRGRRALAPMEIISSRPTASLLYSPWDGDSDTRRAVMLCLRVATVVRSIDVMTLPSYSWYCNVELCQLFREVGDQGHRPKHRQTKLGRTVR